MSRLGKVSLFLSGLSVAIMVSVRYLLDGWQPFLFVPLAIFLIGLVAAIAVDIKFYLEFLTMRTTKHGMNMGVMILLGVILLVAVNYLGIKFNKTFDFTEEHSNSLSQQTRDVLKNRKSDLKIVVFYKGEEAREERNKVKQALELYIEADSNLKVSYYNSYVENFKSQEYLSDLPDKDRGQVFMFVEYGGKKVRVESPFSEEQITQAMIKSTRTGVKTVYFIQGHGERDVDSTEAEGIEDFKKALEADSFKVEKLTLLEKGAIPENADVVGIVGSVSQFFPQEIKLLEDYALKGGRIFIAVDPGQKHNLAPLIKFLGVDFVNNYIFNDAINRLVGKGVASALGLKFDPTSDITKHFKSGQNYTSFDLASEVKPAANDSAIGVHATELVQTDASSFSLLELKQPTGPVQRRSMSLAVQVKGHLKTDGKADSANKNQDSKKEFEAVVFGDSDFLSNKGIGEGLNRDLALNAVAALADQGDLVSIRSPQAKGTKLNMTRKVGFFVFTASCLLPIILLILSGTVWFRRRNA